MSEFTREMVIQAEAQVLYVGLSCLHFFTNTFSKTSNCFCAVALTGSENRAGMLISFFLTSDPLTKYF